MADQMHHFEKTEIRPISFYEILTIPRFSLNYEDLHFQACLVTLNVKRTNNLFFFKSHHNRIRKKRFLILLHYVFPELLWKKDPTCDFYNQRIEHSKSIPNFCLLNTCTRESYLLKQH